jgi:hypothetical protein
VAETRTGDLLLEPIEEGVEGAGTLAIRDRRPGLTLPEPALEVRAHAVDQLAKIVPLKGLLGEHQLATVEHEHIASGPCHVADQVCGRSLVLAELDGQLTL